MALIRKNLQASPGMNIFAAQRWGYWTADIAPTVTTVYFDGAADLLDKGAIIDIVDSAEEALPLLRTYVVVSVVKPTAGAVGDVVLALQSVT